MDNKNGTFLPLWRKFAYGLGNMGNCFLWVAISSFVLMYCTNVVGVSAGVIGTLFMIAKVVDGFTDVFMGRIIDKTKSKLGKARFWYLISCFPLGICMYLIFNVPGTFSDTAKYTYIFVIYLLVSAVFYTANTVAYNTMVALSTKSQKDQTTMSSVSMIAGMIGSVIVSSITAPMAESFGGGQPGWSIVAIIYAVVGVIILLIPFFAIKELPEDELAIQNEVKQEISFVDTIKELLHNKYFIIVLFLYMVGYIGTGINTTIGAYYATYVLGNVALLGTLGMCSMIPMLIGMPFAVKLVAKLGMRKSCVYGNTLSLVGCIIAFLGNYVGFWLIMVGLLIKGFGILPGSATYLPFIAQADEYNYKTTGHRITGSMFSCSSVGIKIGTGLGTALCGWMLELSKFDGQALTQPKTALTVMVMLYLFAPVIQTAISGILYRKMDVEDAIAKLNETN